MTSRRTSRELRRSLRATLVLAVIGCGGCGRGDGPPDAGEVSEFLEETVVAKVGDYMITAWDLDTRLGVSHPDLYEGYSVDIERRIREVLRIQVERLCLVAEAEGSGYADSSRIYHENLEQARRNVLQRRFTLDVLHAQVEPTEAELLDYYERNKSLYSLTRQSVIRHVMVASREEAERAHARVSAGEEFNDVVKHMTLHQASNVTGSVGWVAEGQPVHDLGMLPEFTRAALELAEGEMAIVQSLKGWHLILCHRYQEDGFKPFLDVRQSIYESLHNKAAAVNLDRKLREFRIKYGARVLDENVAAYLAWRRREPEADMFARAQNAQDPRRKIDIYQQFLGRFPQSDFACEARFMIGFTFAEELSDRNNARISLRDFMRYCPDSPLKESAQFLVDEIASATP